VGKNKIGIIHKYIFKYRHTLSYIYKYSFYNIDIIYKDREKKMGIMTVTWDP
jgi:hypothetical protein